MRSIVIHPNTSPYLADISNDLETLQKYVGGYIETVPLYKGCYLICNEEGKIEKLNPSVILVDDHRIIDIVVGTCLILNTDGEEFSSVTDDQIIWFFSHLKVSADNTIILDIGD